MVGCSPTTRTPCVQSTSDDDAPAPTPRDARLGLRQHAIALRSNDGTELKRLEPWLKDCRVVGLGEQSHRDGATFEAKVRLDTPVEVEYFQNGGILQTVLRGLAKGL